MRAVIQRVKSASVSVDGSIVSKIGPGLLAFVCCMSTDTEKDIIYMAGKLAGLRIFDDAAGKMNRSVSCIDGEVLLVSQFTLAGDVRHGNRPSFACAMEPQKAAASMNELKRILCLSALKVKTGVFGADMEVSLINDGPVTILIDTSCKSVNTSDAK